jgi:hypothetical protein
MTKWYYQSMGEVLGPVSIDQLRAMADRGEITERTPTGEGPKGPWQTASRIDGLFEEFAAEGNLALSDDDPSVALAESESPEGPAEHQHVVVRSPLTLRPCSDCGKMVSRHARACPECGRGFHESSFEIPYTGEHPVPVWLFFSVLAVAFILVSPMVVHRLVLSVATRAPEGDQYASQIALVAAVIYSVSMIACAGLGGAIGAPRMAYFTGLLLGLFFGPLGIFAAFAIEKRPHCPSCFERLNGIARECPACHAELTWVLARRWY